MELINKHAKENVDRGSWSGIMDFLMACLAYSVGLANIWRFPFIFYKNGGGAFLVPFILFVVVISTPLVFLEFSLGQFASLGPLAIWRVAPLFKGVGISTVILCTLFCLYNAVSLSLSVFYMCASWQAQLPWQSCDNGWNSKDCCESIQYLENCSETSSETCMLCTVSTQGSISYNISNTTGDWLSPQHEYFRGEVVKLSPSVSSLGTPSWSLTLALLLVWTAVFCILLKGVKVFSKVVCVTGLLPCLLLVVLLIRVCLADGASQGIAAFLRPNWSRLTDIQVWYDAVVQSVFSVGVCYGPLITLASYNNFSRNIARLSVLLPLLIIFSALFIGVLLFATYGALAFDMNTSVDHILKTGLSMSYILWPQFSSSVSVPHLWSTLFYLCLVLLALDTQFISVHCICNSLVDEFPVFFTKWWRQVILLLTLCVVFFLVGIVFVTQGGLYLCLILYHYLTDITPLLLGVAECVIINWVYGFSHFGSNIWTMIGKHPSFFWRLLWQGITPLFLLLAVVYSLVAQNPLVYDDLALPWGAKVSTWVLCGLTLLSLPLYMVYILARTPGSLKQRVKVLLKPSEDWGPAWETREMRKAWMTLPEYMVSEKEVTTTTKRGEKTGKEGEDNQGFTTAQQQGNGAEVDNSDSTALSGEGYMENWFPGMEYSGDNIDTGSIQWSQDENKMRGNWSGRYDFLMSGLGYSIGIGNVWRFPYLVYKNGGGAFFLPYLLMLALCGFPLFFMELAFGQFASTGPLTIWRVSPLFKGIGYAMCTTTFLICSYYNVINAWSVLYLFASMTSTLPWTTCDNNWNSQMCHQRGYRECVYLNTSDLSAEYTNASLSVEYIAECSRYSTNESYSNTTTTQNGTVHNSSTILLRQLDWSNYTTPSEEYFFNYVLSLSSGIDQLGTVQWHLALCLLLCWVVTFAAVIKGIKSVGKVVYVTVVFPFIILFILLVRYATLEGNAYLDGIKYYVTPQWGQLASATLWGDAASQMFFSLGLSIGGLTALGSFNRFHYDCYKDAYIIVIMDTLTSVFAGFVVFAILGVMADEAGTDVENVITAKFALAYIAFPEAVTKLPAAPLWSVLFFLMLFTLAIDSQFLMVEGLVVAITDEFKNRVLGRRLWVILLLCVIMYFLGLPMVSNGGLYILSLMDTYSGSWSPVVNGFMICVVLAWVYKVENFAANLKVMLGKDIGRIQRFMWKFVTPLVLMFILVFSLVRYTPPTLDDYQYPQWAHILAVLTGLSTVICIPIGALVQLLRSRMHIREAVKKVCKPHIEWGPALDKHRANCYMPGVIDLNVKEWVEKGTYGHIFQTESSGNLDILKELTDKNTQVADVESSAEKTEGLVIKEVSSISSLRSEPGSLEDERERIHDMEVLVKWEGGSVEDLTDGGLQGGIQRSNEGTKDMEMVQRNGSVGELTGGGSERGVQSSKEGIRDMEMSRRNRSRNNITGGAQGGVQRSKEGSEGISDRKKVKREEEGNKSTSDPMDGVQGGGQRSKEGNRDMELLEKAGGTMENMADFIMDGGQAGVQDLEKEKDCYSIRDLEKVGGGKMADFIMNGGQRLEKEMDILKNEEGRILAGGAPDGVQGTEVETKKHTVECSTAQGEGLLAHTDRKKDEEVEGGNSNKEFKEVTFAIDLCREPEMSPLLIDKTTQTEQSYIQEHLA